MFTVNWSGKEREFESIDDAIEFMEELTENSDLWAGSGKNLKLVMTRYIQYNGDVQIEDYRKSISMWY